MATRGFTLVELLTAMAVLAIGVSLAVPGMLSLQRSAQLSTAVNMLTGAIQAARGEAMKRNLHAFVVPVANQDWNTGYLIFVDRDRNGRQTPDDVIVARHVAVNAGLELVGTGTAAGHAPYVRFDGSGQLCDDQGLLRLALTIRRRGSVGKPDEHRETRHLLIAATGRVRSCRPASATDRDCSAEPT